MEGDTARELKIFIPQVCLHSNSGLLLGWKKRNGTKTCYMITAVAENEPHRKSSAEHQLILPSEIMGVILDVKDVMKVEDFTTVTSVIHSDWILIERVDSKEPTVKVMGCELPVTCDDILVVVYDGGDIMSSAYLMDTAFSPLSNSEMATNIDIVAKGLADYKQLKDMIQRYRNYQNFYLNDCLQYRRRPCHWVLGFVERILLTICYGIVAVISTCGKCLPLLWPCWLCNTPAVCTQLKRRFCQIRSAVKLHDASPLQRHRSQNLLCLHVFDVCLGFILMIWLLSENRAQTLSTLIMDWAENVAAYLQNLLLWMMGSPAGLKLNRQLAELLGKFFTYHIYLWSGYLRVLRPVQVHILRLIAGSGALGLSFQLSLMCDLVSMMTVHIYCFYVYAARLYCLQMYTLSSLWRLFRGKKWNALRGRIDSTIFNMDQLFLGTLLFTILLFLLPTTALYYTVFMALRLVVLGIQGALYTAVRWCNMFPAASLMARVFCPATISDRVKFSLRPKIPGRPLYLTMKTQAAPLMTLMTSLSEDDVRVGGDSWGSFIKKLLVGDLVYPWVEPVKEKTD